MANTSSYWSSSDFRLNRFKVSRVVLVLVGLLLIFHVQRQRSRNYSTALVPLCPPCSCDCIPESDMYLPSLDVIDSSLADCGKDDPETNDEMKKDMVALLSEEIGLNEDVKNESLEQSKASLMQANRTSSLYKKEAEKCNAGMEVCEEARERAEVALVKERRLTALWMSRAQEYGGKENVNDPF